MLQKEEFMRVEKFLTVLLLTALLVTLLLILTITDIPIQTIQAAPPPEVTPRYEQDYKVLGDGSVIVAQEHLPQQALLDNGECTQPPPTLLEPANGAQLSTLIPDYVWEQVSADVFEYKLEVSRFSDFFSLDTSSYRRTGNPAPGSPFTVYSLWNLLPDTIYYWRVASKCEDTGQFGPYSSAFSFRTAPAGGATLSAPNLLAPDDGATVGSPRFVFAYEAVDSATGYRVTVSVGSDCDPGFLWAITPNTIILAPGSLNLVPASPLYWCVATKNSYAFGDQSTSRSFYMPPVTATTMISPNSGGTLTPDPGNISIQFPPDAVTNTATLSYTLLSTPNQDLTNFRFANRAFILEASDLEGRPVTAFSESFTMTVAYDSFDLLFAGIGDPSKLNLAFWDNDAWESILPCPGCSVDTVSQTVTVVIDHLSEFALLAPKERIYLPIVLR
jgi:hypothetical protein